MSNNDQDELDLSAWEAPAAPPGIADAVIERMGSTDVSVTIPVDPREVPRRRVWVIGGIAVGIVALTIGAWALVRSAQPAAPRSGAIVADRPQTLSLDDITATLDPGADVRWKRNPDGLHVEQRAGVAMWRIGRNEKLMIDAGREGLLAAIEATGANLRVEVEMNAMDAKIIGASAATAAVVAAITIVVYEGAVKVRDKGDTVIVQPGSTYRVLPPPEPQDLVGVAPRIAGEPTAADVRIAAGESAAFHIDIEQIAIEIDGRAQCPQGIALEVDGTASDPIVVLGPSSVKYVVRCAHAPLIVARGELIVLKEVGMQPVKQPPTNPINADGRSYKISFQTLVPNLEVRGAGGVLHLAQGGNVRKYDGAKGVVTVPGPDLVEGMYTLWFERNGVKDTKVTQLVIQHDRAAPIVQLGKVDWSGTVTVAGFALPPATLTHDGIAIPVDRSGRFTFTVPPPSDALVMRFTHPHRGIHYYIRHSTKTVAASCTLDDCILDNYASDCCAKYKQGSAPVTLDRAQIASTILRYRGDIDSCGTKEGLTGTLKLTVVVKPDGTTKSVTTDPASTCITKVVSQAVFPQSQKGGSFSYPFVFKTVAIAGCDADHLKEKGMEMITMGQHAAALAQFEASLRCKPDPYVVQLAFMESCSSGNSAKAKHYYKQMTKTQQDKFRQICVRQKVPYDDPACDADALRDRGMEMITRGQHAAALAQFEATLRCKDDPYIRQLAFMEACSSGNELKAREYYAKLTPAQQNKFAQVCIRMGTPYTGPVATGEVEIHSNPPAKILIDGKDTGKTTPVTLNLTPGKHKVTYVLDADEVGSDRFTYPITVRAGQKQALVKDLR